MTLPLTESAARVVTRAQLVAAGHDRTYGDRQVRAGRWSRLAPSVWLTRTGPPDDAQLVVAARAHAGPDAVVTGLVACRALRLVDVPDEPLVEVLVPPRSRAVSTPHVLVHQTRRPPETWTRDGAAYATAVRAVVDGARRAGDLRTARALVLGAVSGRRCTAGELSEEVEAGPQQGSGLVRRAVDDALAGAWSAPEAEAADHVRPLVVGGRLPRFLLNPLLLAGPVRIGRPDGWLVGTTVAWQVDSLRHHGSDDDDFDRTLAVHDDFAAYGFTVLHVTPRRLRLVRQHWAEGLVASVEAARDHRLPRDLRVEPSGPVQSGPLRRPLDPR